MVMRDFALRGLFSCDFDVPLKDIRLYFGFRPIRHFKDLSYIKRACNRCGSAFVAANTRHVED
jgi:hypothetical protein